MKATKQTAVEWLIDWMGKNQYFIGNDLLQAVEQAKAMEREQLEFFFKQGHLHSGCPYGLEEVYKKTFQNESNT